MNQIDLSVTRSQDAVQATNKVLRNTYMLLSMTLLCSAVTAGISMAIGLGPGSALVLSLVGFGMIFWVHKSADSSQGIVAIFAFAAVMGAALGPLINRYLGLPSGPAIVMQALGGTALIFLSLSGYVLTTRKDFSYMGGFLMTGLIVAIVASLANIFLGIPVLSLAISAAVVMIMSGLILFDTSRIINGGETNYIRATISLYLNIYNLFTSLLHLLGAFNDE